MDAPAATTSHTRTKGDVDGVREGVTDGDSATEGEALPLMLTEGVFDVEDGILGLSEGVIDMLIDCVGDVVEVADNEPVAAAT